MNKTILAIVFSFFLLVAQASAVSLFLNWPNGGVEDRVITQGNDITFNYDAYDSANSVFTKIVLINAEDPNTAVQTFIDQTDVNGDYGFVVFSTDALPVGNYAIYGESTAADETSITELDFTLEAPVSNNTAPYFDVDMPTYFIYNLSDANDILFNIADYAHDGEGDSLSFSLDASNTDSDVVSCNMYFESSLYCEFNGVGITTLDVVVSDGELSATQTVTIQIIDDSSSNTAPYFVDLPSPFSYPLSDGSAGLVKLSDYAYDDQGDALSFSVSGGDSVATCTVQADTTLFCTFLAVGTTDLSVTVSDGDLSSTGTISLTVYDDANPNTAPYFDGLPTYFEYPVSQGSADLVDLADYAYDADGDALTYSVSESIDGVVCSITQDSVLHCDFDVVTTGTMTVTVSDGSLSDSQDITITIVDDTTGNTAPYWLGLPFNYAYPLSDGSATVVSLADYAFDNEGDSLSFILDESSTDAAVIDCLIDQNNNLFCIFNGLGTTTVDVTVSDGELSSTQTLTIEVNTGNNTAPSFDVNMPTNFSYPLSDQVVTVIQVSNYVTDADGDILTYTLDESNTNTNILDCFLDANTNLICVLYAVGTTTVDVVVSDGYYSISQTLTINVYNNNTAPYFDVNMPLYFEYDIDLANVDVLDLADYAYDADGDVLSYSLDTSSTDASVIGCTLNGSVLNCDLNGLGTSTLDVIISDGSLSATQTITILVYDNNNTGNNTAPYFNNLMLNYSYDIDLGTVDVVRLSDVVVDDENDPLTFSLDTSSTDASIIGCSLLVDSTLRCDLNGLGTTTLDVAVSDGEFTAIATISINVYDDNNNNSQNNTSPYFDANMPIYFVYNLSQGQADLFKVSDYVYDDENDPLTFSLDTSGTDANILSCSLELDSTLHCDFAGVGLTSVDVLVSDGEFTIAQTVLILIIDDSTLLGPVAVISADGTRNVVGTPYSFNGLLSYTASGETITSYEWVIRDHTGLAIATFSGASQIMTFTTQDAYTLELTVTDSRNLTGTAVYALQSRWGAAPKPYYGPEDGIFINSLEIHGTGFEQAKVNGEILIVATIENVGEVDLENVRMVFTIPEVGFKIKSNAISLDVGERKTLQIFDYLPDYVYEGIYYPVVSISDTEIRRSKPMYLEVMG